ncbi:MAG: hypothetical protein AB7P22_06685 [Vicinamibacterales bacterium]
MSPHLQSGTIEACVRTAVETLTGLDRPPSLNAGKTLARSEHFWTAVEPAKRELLARVRGDHGDDDDAPQTLLGLQEGYVEARLFRTSMFLRLVDAGGPVTHKGRTRALYTAYLAALDRETKLAQLLGLTRTPRKVETLQGHLASTYGGTR